MKWLCNKASGKKKALNKMFRASKYQLLNLQLLRLQAVVKLELDRVSCLINTLNIFSLQRDI